MFLGETGAKTTLAEKGKVKNYIINEYIIDVAILQLGRRNKEKTGVARIKMLFIQQQGKYERFQYYVQNSKTLNMGGSTLVCTSECWFTCS